MSRSTRHADLFHIVQLYSTGRLRCIVRCVNGRIPIVISISRFTPISPHVSCNPNERPLALRSTAVVLIMFTFAPLQTAQKMKDWSPLLEDHCIAHQVESLASGVALTAQAACALPSPAAGCPPTGGSVALDDCARASMRPLMVPGGALCRK